MSFTRLVEDFVCNYCGKEVKGDGFTNHCPNCLRSMHVDCDPGDRASSCRGIMEPICVYVRSGVTRIRHKCVLCGFIREQNSSSSDDKERLIKLSAKPF